MFGVDSRLYLLLWGSPQHVCRRVREAAQHFEKQIRCRQAACNYFSLSHCITLHNHGKFECDINKSSISMPCDPHVNVMTDFVYK